MKSNLLIILAIFFLKQGVLLGNEPIIKASIIRGENMVTANVSSTEIEQIFRQEILNREWQNKEGLLVDVFVFQFPAEYPVITVTIRSNQGVHFIDKERIKLFGDRKIANLNLSKKLANRLPVELDLSINYDLSFEDIVSSRKSLNIIRLSTNAVSNKLRKGYSNNLNWNENEPISFIVNDFDKYLSFCINYQGIRKKIRMLGPIIIYLQIDETGVTQVERIDSPFSLKEKEKLRLQDAIAALPIWSTDEVMNGIELKMDLN